MRLLKRIIKWIFRRDIFIWKSGNFATEFHGSEYGGWAILANSLSPEAKVLSFGVGEDASFDLSIIDMYHCTVNAYDPTPKSIQWVKENIVDDKFCFKPVGLAAFDGCQDWYLPRNLDWVSASYVENKFAGKNIVSVDVSSLGSILETLKWNDIDVLKMDIEGAEYPVIEQLNSSGLLSKIKQFLVEFHHFDPTFGARATRRALKILLGSGFKVAWISPRGTEVLFVR